MNTKYLFFALLSMFLAGCELGQYNELASEKPVALDEVKAVLAGELLTPPGKRKSVYFYQYDNDHFLGRSDYYYNDQGKEILLVGLNAAKDTFSVALYDYDTFGNQIIETGYDKVNNMYKWFSTKTSEYNETGKLLQYFIHPNNSPKRLVATYHYNEKDLLEFIQFYSGQVPADRYLYDYDNEDRVTRFRWVGPTDDDIAIHDYYYRYDNQNRLESKVTRTGIAPGEPMKEVFEYFYNEKGQLVEEREYYPEMGYPLRYKKVYEYYPELEVTED